MNFPVAGAPSGTRSVIRRLGVAVINHRGGLRANIMVLDEDMNPCAFCESYEYGDPKCPTCRENNYKFYKFKENTDG
jgi:hypothetical protein